MEYVQIVANWAIFLVLEVQFYQKLALYIGSFVRNILVMEWY